MEIAWVLILIFAFSTMVFLALAFFLPEWVGISRPDEKDATGPGPNQAPEGQHPSQIDPRKAPQH